MSEALTIGEYEDKYGTRVVVRAELMCAMCSIVSCLTHFAAAAEWRRAWIPDDTLNDDILDWDPNEAKKRTADFVELANKIHDVEFKSMVVDFLDLLEEACGKTVYYNVLRAFVAQEE